MGILNAAKGLGAALTNIRQSPIFSVLTTVSGFVGGIMVANGGLAANQQVDVSTAFNQMVQGLSLIGQGTVMVATAVGVILPIALGLWNALASTLKSQTKAVMASPAAPAVVAAVADSPAVVSPIGATPAVAAAANSPNVVPVSKP